MKKKLLVLLLIIAVAAFVFAGCTPPAPSEGEGEGEGEEEEIIIAIAGQYEEAGRTYVKGGNRKITVTFPKAVSGVVTADVSDCSGDYSKGTVGLFSADGKVWEGSVSFPCEDYITNPCTSGCISIDYECCSSVVTINYEGKKEQVAVIVDCEDPRIGDIEVCLENCACEGCKLTFKSDEIKYICDDNVFCEDNCSGFGGWTIALYKKNPFDKCCETPCYEPIDTGSGDCRVDWKSNICLESSNGPRTVWALVTFFDNVGNTVKWLAKIDITYCGDNCNEEWCEEGLCCCIDVEGVTVWGGEFGEKICADGGEFRACTKYGCK